jgi:hypothetical protein
MATMKRLLMVLAAVFATASTSALAGDSIESEAATLASKAVQMTDAQLDDITAAGAVHGIAVSNPGNAMHFRMNEKGVMCINCDMLPSGEGTFVQMFVVNKAHPESNPLIKCLGRCPGL